MRTRVILPNRQILSSDVNEINANQIYNQKIVNDGIIGVSKGVITGLDATSIANTATVFYIPSGIVCDGEGTFYELLSTSSITMSGGSGTYKAYVQYCTINDTPISGYTLLDVSTRTESFTTVNTRTYDGLSGNVTTGTVPTNAVQVANVVWDGAAITSVTDARSLVTIAALPAYSLQGFVQSILNFACAENKVSGYIIDSSDTNNYKWSKATISNSHAGTGFETNVGQNSLAKGFVASTSGNIGYIANNAINSSSGFVAYGTSDTGNGFIASDNSRGFVATAGSTGFVSNNNSLGMEITDCTNQLRIKPLNSLPTSPKDGEIAVVTNGTTSSVKLYNGVNWATQNNFSWAISTADSTFPTDSGIIANKGTLLTYLLPPVSVTGQVIKIAGMNAGLWKISQGAGQQIHFNDRNTTSGTGGYLASTLQYNCVELVCSVANLEWIVTSSVGNITVV